MHIKKIHSLTKYLSGLFVISLGINLSIVAKLGVSAVNSVPYAISLVSNIHFGICVISVYVTYVFFQYLILRKDFTWKHLMQIVFVTIFGQFVTLTGHWMYDYLVADTVIMQYIMLCGSLFLTATGISMYMQADLILLPVEGLSFAIATKIHKPFATIKTALDISFVVFSVLVGLIFEGKIVGVGIGTVISAVTIGRLIPYTNKIAEKI